MKPTSTIRSSTLIAAGLLTLLGGTIAHADYKSAVLADGPLAYYRFNEANITTAPYSPVVNLGTEGVAGNGTSTGTPFDSTIVNGVPGALADPANTAFSFPSGAINAVVVPYDAGLNPSGPFSVELWVNPASSSTFNSFASSADVSGYSGWLFYQGDSGQASGNGWWFRIYEPGVARINAQYNMTVTPGTWYHLVGVYDGTYIYLYVNGTPVVTNTPTGYAATPNMPLTFGTRSDNSYPYAGAIDEPAIYASALSASDIAAHYAAATTNATGYAAQILAANPVGYWRFNEPPAAFPPAPNSSSAGAALDGAYRDWSTTVPDLQPPTYSGLDSTNRVLQVSGTNGHVHVPALNLNANTATFECWLKRTGDQQPYAGLLFDSNGGATSGFDFNVNNQLGYQWNNNGSQFASGLVPPDGQWVYAALAISANQAAIYMYDGTTWSAATNALANLAASFNVPLLIGWDPGNNYYNGFLDEAAIYNKTLSAGQLRSHALAAFGDTHAPKFVTDPPVLLGSGVVYAGYPFSLGVDAYGVAPLTFQWRKDGTALPDATNTTYAVSVASPTDSGNYDVIVTNPYGSITNTVALALNVRATTNPDLTTGLRTWLKFDETTGLTAYDSSGSGRNGTLQGFPGDDSQWVPGCLNRAVALNMDYWGEQQVVLVHDDGALDFSASQEFTLAAWVKVNLDPQYQGVNEGIIAKGHGNGGEQFSLDIDVGHYRFFVRDASGAAHVWGTSVATNGVWQHICAVYSASLGVVKIYINGIEVLSSTPPSSLLPSSHDVSLGARQQNSDDNGPYDYDLCGLIDDARIYGRALLPFEVSTFYAQAPNPPYFTLPPADTTVADGMTANLYCSAYGRGTVTYQWQVSSDGGSTFTSILGEVSTNLTLVNVRANMDGYLYRAVASNGDGSTPSASAKLTVISGPPQIVTDLPSSQTILVGQTLILAVTNLGTAPFTYRWQSSPDGSAWAGLANGGRISGANTNVLVIANVQLSDALYYKVAISNGQGSAESGVDQVTVLDSTAAFNNGVNWTLNFNALVVSSNVVDVTQGIGQGERGSLFFNAPLYVGAFRASFTYQPILGAGSPTLADGMSFCLQNDPRGAAAIGATASTFGVQGYPGAVADIAPSVELCFNIYSPIGYSWNNNANVTSPSQIAPGSVNLASGNPINVTVTYFGGVVALTLTDTNAQTSFSTNLNVGDITSVLGADTAYVGFTGGDGGYYATQQISDFSYVPLAALSAQLSSTNTLVLTWPTDSGFGLQSKSDLASGTWQNMPVGNVGGQAVVPVSAAKQFYRLVLQ